MANKIEPRFFFVGIVFLIFGLGLAGWAFAKGQLSSDQRMILLWALPLVSGFACGCFTGSANVKTHGVWKGVAATATGGFAVWLLTYFLLPKPGEKSLMDSLQEFNVYVQDTHKSNVSALDDAIKRDPDKARVLERVKQELDQTVEELIKNVIEHPGLPARTSKNKYNDLLQKAKEAYPAFSPHNIATIPIITELPPGLIPKHDPSG